jgi:predicted RNA-binding protein
VKEGVMCEINAFVLKDGKEELYLESVNFAKSEEGRVFLKNLFGEQKEFEGTITEVSLVKNRLILEKTG